VLYGRALAIAGRKERNLPIVHTGNIARLSGEERIPVRTSNGFKGHELVDGYLVEAQTLKGLSGSPVFIRPSCSITVPARDEKELPDGPEKPLPLIAYRQNVKLLGLWQAAWDAPPGEVLTGEMGQNNTVPIGMGIVVPCSKIIEVLELPSVRQKGELMRRMIDTYNISNANKKPTSST
jgi:hypothetical protein